ncbi:unnamed protein product, partial [Brassica rapa]
DLQRSPLRRFSDEALPSKSSTIPSPTKLCRFSLRRLAVRRFALHRPRSFSSEPLRSVILDLSLYVVIKIWTNGYSFLRLDNGTQKDLSSGSLMLMIYIFIDHFWMLFI